MKTLVESIFDDNKDILFGEVLELDKWDTPDVSSESLIENIMNSNFKTYEDGSLKKIEKTIEKPQWRSFLSPFEDYYSKQNFNDERYWWVPQFPYFTWVVMCCKSCDEIKKKLKAFINDCRNTRKETSWHRTHEYINKVDVEVLKGVGDMKELPRMVLIRFYTEQGNVFVHMTLKKKD